MPDYQFISILVNLDPDLICILYCVAIFPGVFYAMAIIGPALGYLMGGEMLKRYTDIDSVDVSR